MTLLRVKYCLVLGDTHFDIDLDLPASGITAIFGRSGAGKTSLINVVAGLLRPDEGEIVVQDRTLFSSLKNLDVPVHKRNVGYVFQDARLFPNYRVKGNLLYGVKKMDPDHVETIIKLLALEPLLDRFPSELSGGEKQRVAIGRALLAKPDILLMDEPLASLDMPRKREVMPFLEELADRVQIPILYVTHSLNEILRLANYLVIIDDGQAVTSGPVEQVWSTKAMRPWQSFSDQSSLFEASIETHNDDYALSQLKLATGVHLWVQRIDALVGTSVRLQVRSNDVSLALEKPRSTSIRNILPAEIVELETRRHGGDKQSVAIKLALGEGCCLWATVTAWARDELGLHVGMQVFAQVKGVSVTQRDVALTH